MVALVDGYYGRLRNTMKNTPPNLPDTDRPVLVMKRHNHYPIVCRLEKLGDKVKYFQRVYAYEQVEIHQVNWWCELPDGV